jgi:hypothetical protein
MATSTIPDQYKDLLSHDKKAFANLAAVMPDGSPQVTAVWFDWHGGNLRVNTARGRVKDRNMQRDAKVVVAILEA